MNIQQFHRALTTSDDPTIAALRRLREGDPRMAGSAMQWFVWPAATERSQTSDMAIWEVWRASERESAELRDWLIWTANQRESAELGDWLLWGVNERESAELSDWLPWGVREGKAASPA